MEIKKIKDKIYKFCKECLENYAELNVEYPIIFPIFPYHFPYYRFIVEEERLKEIKDREKELIYIKN